MCLVYASLFTEPSDKHVLTDLSQQFNASSFDIFVEVNPQHTVYTVQKPEKSNQWDTNRSDYCFKITVSIELILFTLKDKNNII